MTNESRKGIHPLRDLGLYLHVLRRSKSGGVYPVSFEYNFHKEKLVGHGLKTDWERPVPLEQRKLFYRLDTDPVKRSPYCRKVWMLPTGNIDIGFRLAWCFDEQSERDHDKKVLAVNLGEGLLYSPPESLPSRWKHSVSFAAWYALEDKSGWRKWSQADQTVIEERGWSVT